LQDVTAHLPAKFEDNQCMYGRFIDGYAKLLSQYFGGTPNTA